MVVTQVIAPTDLGAGLHLVGGKVVADAALASVVLATGNRTITTNDRVVINVGPAATWTLPAAAGAVGVILYLTNQGTGTITFSTGIRTATTGTQTTLPNTAAGNTITIVSDGAVWRRIAR